MMASDEYLQQVGGYLDLALEQPAAELDLWLQQLGSHEPQVAAVVRDLLAARRAQDYPTFLEGQACAAVTAELCHLGTADARHCSQDSFFQHGVPPRLGPERQGCELKLRAATGATDCCASPRDCGAEPQRGELIGNYRLLDEVGRGGMAVVYRAERADGLFEQHVALKFLRFWSGSAEAWARFAQERQILACLNHPSIARLVDGGITAAGIPYLVMEYAAGTPIDQHCDERRMTIEARLRLFVRVAQTVEYAHRHLVVHRDLKPSNILITPDQAVKLLDFGIAKLLNPEAMPHAAPPTVDIRHLMTPQYASPEQARGGAVTTAADIYQLGVLLYELLTGRSPYQQHNSTSMHTLRAVCELEPLRPSAAVLCQGERSATSLSLAAARAMTPERLCRRLRGDLDNIILKAMQKEPERRYGSVRELREDILRLLEGRPVQAHRATWSYRAAKFVRRHAAVLSMASAVAVAFSGTVGWYTIRLAHERDRAEFEAQKALREARGATQASDFLVSLLHASDPYSAAPDITARQLLERGAARVASELAGEPRVQARMMSVIGRVYVDMELQEKAQPLLEQALQRSRELFGENSPEVADSMQALARLAQGRGEFLRAQELYRRTLAIRERLAGGQLATADTLTGLATVLIQLAEAERAIAVLGRAQQIYTRTVGDDDSRALRAADALAAALREAGQYTRARELYELLLPRMERRLGALHPQYGNTLAELASLRASLGDQAGAEAMLRRAIDINERLYGQDYAASGAQLTALADLLNSTGRFTDAIPIYERAITTHERSARAAHPFVANAYAGLARDHHARGDYTNAQLHYETALAILRRSLGAAHPRYMVIQGAYGELCMEMGQLEQAAAQLSAALAAARHSRSAGHPELAEALVRHALLLSRSGMPGPAELQVRVALNDYRQIFPPGHPASAAATSVLGEALLAQGRLSEAAPVLLDSAAQLQSQLDPRRRNALQRLVRLAEAMHDGSMLQRYRAELEAFERRARAQ